MPRDVSETASFGAFSHRKTPRISKRIIKGIYPHMLFAAFLLTNLLPNRIKGDSFAFYAIVLAAVLEAIAVVSRKRAVVKDLVFFMFALLIVWTLATSKLNLLREFLFAPPGKVLRQFILDYRDLVRHIFSSLGLILNGYVIALAAAVPLGLFIGYSMRAGRTATLISKFLSSIPPIVYIPYGIALLPTFRSVSVMVIFLATFWPVLSGTIAGVMYTERKYLDVARNLGCGKFRTLFRIVLPSALPQIFTGCNQGLSVSFILLTSAEMIGARNGMGYYVNYFSDLGDYTRTMVGVFLIGIVISVVYAAVGRLQKFILRWQA
ncbi:MAG: ABC transporter permease [Synergistaceae bacterium]|nr:ABC transporter permease [Synergistaceae bacterium]